jgi:hypothetical protein
MKRKHLTETPVCPRERLVIISYTTGLSFALERIGQLAAIVITVFYLSALYLLALPNTPENPFASIYSESLIKTTCQHLLLLVWFDTLIYRKYYDTPPILVGHQRSSKRVQGRRGRPVPQAWRTPPYEGGCATTCYTPSIIGFAHPKAEPKVQFVSVWVESNYG